MVSGKRNLDRMPAARRIADELPRRSETSRRDPKILRNSHIGHPAALLSGSQALKNPVHNCLAGGTLCRAGKRNSTTH